VFAANQDFPAHQCNRATKLRTCDGTMSDLFLNASRTVGVMFCGSLPSNRFGHLVHTMGGALKKPLGGQWTQACQP